MLMTETITPTKLELLLDKVAKLIKAQTSNEATGLSRDSLNHIYMSLIENTVDADVNDLLIKLFGPDWAEGLEPFETDEDIEDEAKDSALASSIEQISESDVQEAVSTLSLALMFTCRELGWATASRAAHDQWFSAGP